MKGLSLEEKARILGLAGNPKNGSIEELVSIPNGYRIVTRIYSYNPVKKRSKNTKRSLGVVIGDKFYTSEEYRKMFTKRGLRRTHIPDTAAPEALNAGKNAETAAGSVPGENAANSAGSSDDPTGFGAFYQRMIGAVPILYGTAVNCGIADDLNAAYGDPVFTKEILSIAIHWIMDRDNVAKRFPRFSKTYALPFPGQITDEQMAKLYSCLGFDKVSLSKLFSLRCKRVKSETRINYDSTSIPTTASDIYYRHMSKSKEGVIEPMMHLSVLVEQDTGMPVMYRLFSENNPDCITVNDLIFRIEELFGDVKGKNILFVFDRGYESKDNLLSCSMNGKSCLMAAKNVELKFIREVRNKFDDFWDLSSIIPGTAVNGHSAEVKLKHRGEEFSVWVHVFRSDEKSAVETKAFLKQLDKFEQNWKSSSRKDRAEMVKDPLSRFYNFRELDGLRDRIVRNGNAINEYTRDFGFFANVSLSEMTSEQAYNIYRGRDNIEKYFESGKMGIKLDTVRAHRQDTMEGRFVVAFVALSIIAELKFQLGKARVFKDRRKKKITPHEYSVADVIDMTAGITINHAVRTCKSWISGKLNDIARLSVACGFSETLYDKVPDYIESISDIR